MARLFHYRITLDAGGSLGIDTGAGAYPVARVVWEGDAPGILDALAAAEELPDLSDNLREELHALADAARELAGGKRHA